LSPPSNCCSPVAYHQYDTYFFFDDPTQGRLRYREDEFLDERHTVTTARARLTLTGPAREAAFGAVLLFRSRFLAPAAHTPRFYREYSSRRASGTSRRIAAAGSSAIVVSSSTSTSIAC
jgi:hypothetical protein